MRKLRCGLLGATGIAGQQFVDALAAHPLFDLVALAASPQRAGQTYREALSRGGGSAGWCLPRSPDARIAKMRLAAPDRFDIEALDLVFSAVETDVARILEPLYAEALPVVSTASAFRGEADVPLLIPPINASHLPLVRKQAQRGWRGFILPIPNCTTTGLAMTLAPLEEAFGLKAVMVTSLQAASGAGRSPGVPALDLIDNVVPYIPNEEEKVERETQKILGKLGRPADLRISATCTRVPVLDGHTEVVAVSLKKKASEGDVAACFRAWRGDEGARKLPSSPPQWIVVLEDPYRPQPRLDRDTHGGMATTVGRLRTDVVLPNGFKYVLVSHNTRFGAAQGALLVAELLVAQRFIGERDRSPR